MAWYSAATGATSKATTEAFTDGCSRPVIRCGGRRVLTITGRKKELSSPRAVKCRPAKDWKTSAAAHPLISQGGGGWGRQPFIGALITTTLEASEGWKQRNIRQLARRWRFATGPDLIAEIGRQMLTLRCHMPSRSAVPNTPVDLQAEDTGELTPTMKVNASGGREVRFDIEAHLQQANSRPCPSSAA